MSKKQRYEYHHCPSCESMQKFEITPCGEWEQWYCLGCGYTYNERARHQPKHERSEPQDRKIE